MIIDFYKYQGTGNDFILIDDRENVFDITNNQLVADICERRMGIGADGLILLRTHKQYDFEMIYFNSDGYQSSMCGNGGRCIVAFANMLGIIKNETVFMAIDGVHEAKINKHEVCLKMQDVIKINKIGDDLFLDTGSPHYVKLVDNCDTVDIEKAGREIRNSASFKKDGVNVNFASNTDKLKVRTYERGVERETLSCGTGVVATAIAMHYNSSIKEDFVVLKTLGGSLSVSFEEFKGSYKNIWLSGETNMVYSGEFSC